MTAKQLKYKSKDFIVCLLLTKLYYLIWYLNTLQQLTYTKIWFLDVVVTVDFNKLQKNILQQFVLWPNPTVKYSFKSLQNVKIPRGAPQRNKQYSEKGDNGTYTSCACNRNSRAIDCGYNQIIVYSSSHNIVVGKKHVSYQKISELLVLNH